MTFSSGPSHTYLRSIDTDRRTSLSAIAERVPAGSTVLDVGTGSGALGEFLSAEPGCIVDGLTHNAEEAAIAAEHYRNMIVADLETEDFAALCQGRRYDVIVCADVLEHLRRPESVLDSCRQLLEPDGQLLISVPNVGYVGLIAELLRGEFEYRVEGLLDETHLRFFTRRSLSRFLARAGWLVSDIEAIEVDVADSEFEVDFAGFAPALQRQLLSLEDAAAYQFIASARPGDAQALPAEAETRAAERTAAHFSCQLYVDCGDGYQEDAKLLARGLIGEHHQTVSFDLAGLTSAPKGIRFDPADRPGLLSLYAIRLYDRSGTLVWDWDGSPGRLARPGANQVSISRLLGAPGGVTLLMSGDDPNFELPIPEEALQQDLGVIAFDLSWPMSADASLFAHRFADQELRHADDLAELDKTRQTLAAAEQRCADFGAQIATLEARIGELDAARDALAQLREADLETLEQLRHEHLRLENQSNSREQHRAELSRELADVRRELGTARRERASLIEHLERIESSTVFRATRPLVRAKMALDSLLGRRPAGEAPRPADDPQRRPAHPVDVIVPVYRGLDDTRCCIESVLASTCETEFRLVVINDASPEPEVTEWLRKAAADNERIMLLENEENLGFVATVNRGMALSDANDVVLLNSDAQVANDWLDRLRSCAYRAPRIASVTPFSNNATICSYPRFCEDNALPEGHDTASLDQLFAQTNRGQATDVPTGVGFCMYITRASLAAVGLFDVERFGKGYGEENDFCMRAANDGWRNLFALDVFVRHAGGVSFGANKSPREKEAQRILQSLHPRYEALVHEHIIADPARGARLAVDVARIRARGLPLILYVTHNRGGGTLRHVKELAAHVADQASSMILSPAPGGELRLELCGEGEGFALNFLIPEEFEQLVQTLIELGVAHIHYHHMMGQLPDLFGLPRRLGVAFDFTAHDFYALCPQITLTDHRNRYCGELGPEQCAGCLKRSPAPGGVSIEVWRDGYRQFLSRARHVFAPSEDAISRIAQLVPEADLHAVPHADLDSSECPAPEPSPKTGEHVLKIVLIGALSIIKGADVLEAAALEAARRDLPIEFHLIGFAYRSLQVQPRARLTVHGEYDEEDLPGLLSWIEPDLVWFPAQWPETYSYTLSAAIAAGLPVVAPDLGAFRERLEGRPWTWVLPWDKPTAELLDFFDEIRGKHFVPGNPPEHGAAPERPSDRFRYRERYVLDVETRPISPEIDISALSALRAERRRGVRGVRNDVKQQALRGLVRLRNAPGLRAISKRIPLRWQTRVKTWLLN